MAQPKQTPEDVRRHIIHNLSWRAATRDDRQVAQALRQGKELDAVYGLNEVGLLDEFWHFLGLIGVLALVATIQVPAIERVMIPVVQMVLLYLLKILFGIVSMNALPALLFSNVAAMTLIGFNAYQVRNGLTKRGDHARQKKPKQGPLTPQCLAQNISKIPAEGAVAFFNGGIRYLAAFGIFAAEVTAIVDGTRIETTADYEGHGTLTVERRKRQKGGGWVTVIEYLFGWKLVALIDLDTRIPLAVQVIKIEAYEGEWLVPLVKQAQANLGDHARIVKVVADRGYLDGVDLGEIHQMGLVFVILSKAGMKVREAALAKAAQGPVQSRSRTVRHGHGRFQTTETLTTELVAVTDLNEYLQFGPPPEPGKRRRRKNNPRLNAVVVRKWNNRVVGEGGHVYLTNGTVENAFAVFDTYDGRSVIENGLFREGKGAWVLEHAPQKNENAVIVHVVFTMAVMALATAYRIWSRRQEYILSTAEGLAEQASPQTASALLEGEGATAWRRRLLQENRDKVIVFVDEHYGIFHVMEFAILAGLHIKAEGIPPELGSSADILAHYGLSP
jgi:hypothetical protein